MRLGYEEGSYCSICFILFNLFYSYSNIYNTVQTILQRYNSIIFKSMKEAGVVKSASPSFSLILNKQGIRYHSFLMQ